MQMRTVLLIGIVTFVFLSAFFGAMLYAKDSPSEVIRQDVAQEKGLSSERLEVANEEYVSLPLTNKGYTYAKIVDRKTGKGYGGAADANGNIVDHKALKAAEDTAHRAKYGKLHPSLHNALQNKKPDELVKVSFWLDMGGRSAEVSRATPQEARALGQSEVDNRRQQGLARAKRIHAEVERPLIDRIRQKGFDARGADTAPLVFAQLPRKVIEELGSLPFVEAVDLVVEGGPELLGEKTGVGGPETGGPEAETARDTEKADVVEGRGIDGSGVRLAVVEGDGVSDQNPNLDNAIHSVTYYDPTCPDVYNWEHHATVVAGFMASTHASVRGTAPGIDEILSANSRDVDTAHACTSTDPGWGWDLEDHQPAVDWALLQGASALNNSYYLEEDGTMHNSDRWADYVVRTSADVFIKSSGNLGRLADPWVTSPGLGFNVLTVGSIDDLDDADWTNDTMSAFSSWDELTSSKKPEVVAVGCQQSFPASPSISLRGTLNTSPWVGVTSGVDPWFRPFTYPGCGTSYAAPAVTGMMATLINRDAGLAGWPEAEKAIAIASALHDVDPGDKDGAGAIDMAAADYIAANGWWDGRTITGNSFDANSEIRIPIGALEAGEAFRGALAYDSNPSADYSADPLEGDLDLRLYDSAGSMVASATGIMDSWENLEWTVTSRGSYELAIHNWGNLLTPAEETFAGVAWWKGHYVLGTAIQERATPTSAGDHYRFDASSAADWWAIGVRPPSGGDYDIDLYDESAYGNPAAIDWLEDSKMGGDTVEIVVVDRNHAPGGDYYPIAEAFSGTGNYRIQKAGLHGTLSKGSYTTTTLSHYVAGAWDIQHTGGQRKFFRLDQSSGNADLGLLLFDSDPTSASSFYQGRSQAVAWSDSGGAGQDESMNYQTATGDDLGLVVYNNQGQTSNANWTLYVDDTAPSGVVTINGGDAMTNSTAVNLTLFCTDTHTSCYQMRFSNDGASWSGWEAFATTKNWTLSSGDGIKTVYAQYLNNALMTAEFSDTITLATQTLVVKKDGPGNGTITSSPAGIDCGPDCFESYVDGTIVKLTVDPDVGSTFDGWIGDDPDCADGKVTMDADKQCRASFGIETHTLTVTLAGTGSGTVTSTPAGISCEPDCEETYDYGEVVNLSAAVDPGSSVTDWGGDPDCTDGQVTMNASKTCTVTFDLVPWTLSVAKTGTGSGVVTSDPAGINCGADCSQAYDHGTVVKLIPAPGAGSVFGGWSGHPDCSNGEVTMDATKSCTAAFDLTTHTLSVTIAGTGSGTVDIDPPGVTCDPGGDPDCTQIYSFGQLVDLVPSPDASSVFASWNGDPDCSDGQVTMDATKSCEAAFNLSDTTPPSIPQKVIAAPTDVDAAMLSWDASTDTGGSGVAGYRVYDTKTGALVADVSATSHALTSLVADDYSYFVNAYDEAGNVSERSRFAAIRLPVRFAWQSVDILGKTFAANPAGATAKASFIFEGEEVKIDYGCGLNTGIFEVSIDGALVDTVDAYCSSPDFNVQKTYVTAPGGHTIEVRPRGDKNLSSTYFWTLIDGFEVAGEKYEETDGVSYTWQTVDILSDTFAANPAGTTAYASFTYSGDEVSVNYACGLNTGIFEVEIDGSLADTVDAYCSSPVFNAQKTYSTLPLATHTITVRPRGDKNTSSSYFWTLIDSFEAGGSVYQAQALPRSEAEELHIPKGRLSRLLQRLPDPLRERIEKRLEDAGGIASAETIALFNRPRQHYLAY